jgi:hypothetical protein
MNWQTLVTNSSSESTGLSESKSSNEPTRRTPEVAAAGGAVFSAILLQPESNAEIAAQTSKRRAAAKEFPRAADII